MHCLLIEISLSLSIPVSLMFRARVRAHHVSHADGLRGMHQAAVATVQAAGGVRMQEVSNERKPKRKINDLLINSALHTDAATRSTRSMWIRMICWRRANWIMIRGVPGTCCCWRCRRRNSRCGLPACSSVSRRVDTRPIGRPTTTAPMQAARYRPGNAPHPSTPQPTRNSAPWRFLKWNWRCPTRKYPFLNANNFDNGFLCTCVFVISLFFLLLLFNLILLVFFFSRFVRSTCARYTTIYNILLYPHHNHKIHLPN